MPFYGFDAILDRLAHFSSMSSLAAGVWYKHSRSETTANAIFSSVQRCCSGFIATVSLAAFPEALFEAHLFAVYPEVSEVLFSYDYSSFP